MDVSLSRSAWQIFPNRQHGLTLIELLMVIALIGILMGIAAPSFSELLLNQRQISQLNTLVGQLNYARSEAIKQGQWLMVCKSPDGTSCTNSGDWDTGWMVFADQNRDRQRNGDEALLYHHRPHAALSIRYAGFPSPNYVIYYPGGTSLGNGTFTFCDSRGAEQARAVILAKSGRLRRSDLAADGSALVCGG